MCVARLNRSYHISDLELFTGHHWVYTYPKILHRDISDGNIMFREEEGKIYGVLNDWDLALLDPETEKSPTSQFRTGTKPFLAHEQHDFDWTGPH